ncbi:MAG TPA: serine/threonine-protein kinase [Rudaea sp.]
MPTDHRRSDDATPLEQVAARIADEHPIDWSELSEADVAALTGLREIEQLAQGFRHLQVSAVAPKTPTSNRFKFGNLQVLEPLGSGAQGEVWRAYDPLLDLQVALKLRKFDSDALSHQFLEEARRLARVRQANIVSVYGAAVHDRRAGIWTELVRGKPLSELQSEQGVFPAEEVRGIGLDLCHALAAVHRHGLVHGDVKAENVMREVSGRIVLMDFGAAREFELADKTVVSGTLRYLAPEVLRGAAPSPASDVYALGVLLFRLASGEFPYAAGDFSGLVAEQERGDRRRLAKTVRGLPADLVRAIESAIDVHPAKRPATALAFAAALAPQPAPPRKRIWQWLAVAAVGAALIATLIAALRGTGAPAWETTATFYRIEHNGPAALGDGMPIALGDRIALRLRSNRDAYVYVFDDDGSGQAAVQFPIAGLEPANPLAANTDYQLPGRRAGKALTWEVSSAADREQFIVLVSDQPQPLLERTIAPWHHAGEVAATTRGALGLAPAPNEPGLPSAALQLELDRLARDEAHVRRWNFVFPHAAAK